MSPPRDEAQDSCQAAPKGCKSSERSWAWPRSGSQGRKTVQPSPAGPLFPFFTPFLPVTAGAGWQPGAVCAEEGMCSLLLVPGGPPGTLPCGQQQCGVSWGRCPGFADGARAAAAFGSFARAGPANAAFGAGQWDRGASGEQLHGGTPRERKETMGRASSMCWAQPLPVCRERGHGARTSTGNPMATGQGDSFGDGVTWLAPALILGAERGLFCLPSTHMAPTFLAPNPLQTQPSPCSLFPVVLATELLPGRLHPTPGPLLVLRS